MHPTLNIAIKAARRAAAVLTKEGFTDIAILDGGLKTWLDAQLPLVKG